MVVAVLATVRYTISLFVVAGRVWPAAAQAMAMAAGRALVHIMLLVAVGIVSCDIKKRFVSCVQSRLSHTQDMGKEGSVVCT